MTDKELAVDMAQAFVKAKFRIAAQASELEMYRDKDWNHIPWRENVDRTLAEPLLADQAADELGKLKHSIDTASDCNSIVRSLHQYICDE
jgi:hypothetical protein